MKDSAMLNQTLAPEPKTRPDANLVALPPFDVDLPRKLRDKLLEPAAWRASLETFARATNLAVALVDAQGRLLGECINPQPLWRALHANQPAPSWCPFDLALAGARCACTAEAMSQRGVILGHGRDGLAHVAVPLVLGGQPLGALVAGQVFDRFPEQLRLDHLAKRLDLNPHSVWQLARQEQPVKESTLRVYGDLLRTLGDTFLQTCYHAVVDAERLQEMTRLRDQAEAESTERGLAEMALAEADRRKDVFLATLAHELRNPLAPLQNALQVMSLVTSSGAEAEQLRTVMQRQILQMVRLIDDLLDVSRITRGKLDLRKKRVDLSAIIANAVEATRPFIVVAGVQFSIDASPLPMILDADPARIAQVLANLLNNAAKYTPPGGRIELSTQREAEHAVIRVRDTGAGIPAEMLPEIFDLFTQVDSSLTRSQGGLGIGLTLARNLVEMHNGSIHAASAGAGEGSEFTIRLPLAIDEAIEEQSAPTSGPSLPLAAHNILIVDDARDSAFVLRRLLETVGQTVRTASDGFSALEEAGRERPDIVISDIAMPGMSGYDLARELRQLPGLNDVRLVALTGYGQDEDRRKAFEAGFDYHLVKPVSLDALRDLLRSVLPPRRAGAD